MKRGVGIHGLTRQTQQMQERYKKVGETIAAEEMSKMKEQLKLFKENLEAFAMKYKKQINKDPEFRKHFQVMCASIGVDPLASNKGFWAELLGVGDFYYELAVQIVEVCLRTRERNGGLIEMNEMKRLLEYIRGANAQAISQDDIERAIRKLKVLGNGFNIISLGSRKIIQSVPCELNTDHTAVMVLAQDNKGCINASKVKQELSWTDARIETVFNLLLQQGMVWVDDQTLTAERDYWFPSLALS
eukprot:TRINITY_DN9680_c0_g1_i2.p1 TRINITY_DN9680_c0_g1~~TRINITY_DN9680_c0_g1_i2.p1  ORF type:complete len:255 (+),score=64.39 TRINITY_DN9680_c0_g1_i2:31-765(+)